METKIFDYLVEAELQKEHGNHKEAIKLCEKVLLEDPNSSVALEEIADNYLSLGEIHKAKKAICRAIEIEPESANANYLVGFIFSHEQNWESSIEHLEIANDEKPNNPEILRCLGWSIFNSKKQRERQGIVILERAKNISPNDVFILCDLGVCYMSSEKYEKALTLFKDAEKIDPYNTKIKDCIKIASVFGSKSKEEA